MGLRHFFRPTLPLLAGALLMSLAGPPVGAESYERISGEGSSWAAVAIDAMRVNVEQAYGMKVDYNPSGSTAGRKNFLNRTVDFAASDIPFQFKPEDGSEPERPAADSYAYIPITAGGTSFMYNLKINGQRVTNLRLSGENVVKIFTGIITKWNDPAIQADNPGLAMPERPVVPVVRSDGSGSSAQFTRWMTHQHSALWMAFCERSGRAPACGSTSYYPTISGIIAQSGDTGIQTYVSQAQAEGAIGYVNYSYALGVDFPVVKVLNASGHYTEPTPENVAVSLLKAKINNDPNSTEYLTQELEDVYTDPDPRSYPLSSYSYFILPTKVQGQFNEAKGRTLGAFAYYAMCQAQQQSASLGYSPMPINLVQASFEQIKKVPGVEVQNIDLKQCKNPTFSPDGTNLLAANAPMPAACDKQGPDQCATGTGGARKTNTRNSGSGAGGAASAGGAGASGGGGAAGGAAVGANTGGAQGGAAAPSKAAPGSRAGSSSGPSSPAGCDLDTGVCAAVSADPSSDSAGFDESSGSNNEQAVATETMLPASAGWSASQTLAVLAFLFLIVLLVAPPLAWRAFSIPRGKP